MDYPTTILAVAPIPQGSEAVSSDGLATWLIVLAALAILPFVLTMITSFAKIVIVLGIVRQALGTQQIPPTTVITGLALILTVHVMWPVAETGWSNYERLIEENDPGENLEDQVGVILESVMTPMAEFLEHHSHPDNIALFEAMRSQLRDQSPAVPVESTSPPESVPDPAEASEETPDPEARKKFSEIVEPETARRSIYAATVLAPAFILSEITEAFQIGFLIFIPFLVIDLVVSNILLAMGMHMMSPTTVSLPLKLLLFVLVDGWQLILQGLVMGYAIGGHT